MPLYQPDRENEVLQTPTQQSLSVYGRGGHSPSYFDRII